MAVLTPSMFIFIIRCMNICSRRLLMSCTIELLLLFTIISLGRMEAADGWDTDGAARDFRLAQQLRADAADAAAFSLSRHQECAQTYRRVYLKDPHYAHAGDAIYEEGLIYEEMGDGSNDVKYSRTAAQRFVLLTENYPEHARCPDALFRLAKLYADKLYDQAKAQDAFERLRVQYKYSIAARKAFSDQSVFKSAQRTDDANGVPSSSAQSPLPTHIQGIDYSSARGHTRVVIEMDNRPRYEKKRLSNPDRIFFDIYNAALSKNLSGKTIPIEDEFLSQVRVAQNRSNIVRVVLDCLDVSNYSVSELHNPFRLIVDIDRSTGEKSKGKAEPHKHYTKAVSAAVDVQTPPEKNFPRSITRSNDIGTSPQDPLFGVKFRLPPRAVTNIKSTSLANNYSSSKDASKQIIKGNTKEINSRVDAELSLSDSSSPVTEFKASDPTSRGNRTLTRMLGLKIGRIVIDPGHGGEDLGAVGPGGLVEKDLTLLLARRLKTMLHDRLGTEVFLTRNSDVFVSLEERTAIANRLQADLFISIHANSSSIRSISGIETYYLDFARTRSEREVAARENAATISNVSNLEELVKKIAQADKSAESRELASFLQKKLYSGVRTLFPSPKDRGVRTAPFIVLIDANMPAVLTEVAFLTNPRDEKLLKKEANQEVVVKALFSGIEDYMQTLGSNSANNRASSR